MRVVTGRVRGGRVEIPADFVPEGAQVMVLAPEPGEPLRLSPAEEIELLEAMEEIRQGDYIDGDDLLNELRSNRS